MKKVIIGLILLSGFSCGPREIDRSKLVEEELTKRINSYKEIRTNKCYEELMEKVNLEVDSMMYYLVQKMNGKSSEMPVRPDRPGRLVDTIMLEDKASVINQGNKDFPE